MLRLLPLVCLVVAASASAQQATPAPSDRYDAADVAAAETICTQVDTMSAALHGLRFTCKDFRLKRQAFADSGTYDLGDGIQNGPPSRSGVWDAALDVLGEAGHDEAPQAIQHLLRQHNARVGRIDAP